MCLIDPQYLNMPPDHINLINAARLLCEPPIAGQRLIDKLEQQGTVHTVMADKDDGVINMVPENEAQCVRTPSDQVLQRLPARKSNKMRCRKPSSEELRIRRFGLFVASPLPRSIVDIVEVVEHFGFGLALSGYRRAGRDASPHRACVDNDWAPCRRDALGNGVRLCVAEFGKGQVCAPTESLRLDALHMTVAD